MTGIHPKTEVPVRLSLMPVLFQFDNTYARDLGLDPELLGGPESTAIFAGNRVPAGAEPLAQAYAGHQFGGFSPQLGDGRALLLGEVIDRHGRRRDVALKDSGRTAFSGRGDGKAAAGPMLREALMGEAMHPLRLPTTRALAMAATGETVHRERPLPGAVLTRVAASHLRVGTFEYFRARRDTARLRQLAD
ncbi:hypothetical protein DEIGR_330075 [Deinococcus grandis]|uniref:Selenoprotein O n=2 Tax=Deinococcus grandis TaxID=57498 RepID=A0A117DPQ6_9DEIO|nr:hypothetical protein DEGR_36330 [Deinococcus grandis]GAQ23817.1 hypothetical protein DEIGR_330075 [Deinococcus grandis]